MYISEINSIPIIHLPKTTSEKFSSRGMNMAIGKINGNSFVIPLEPDGKGSHWFNFTEEMQNKTGAAVGDKVELILEPIDDWHEPDIPDDIKNALNDDPEMHKLWLNCTTKGRWEWIRWIRSTANPDTRKLRIEKSRSKLKKGLRRPCCFNQSMCTIPSVSKSGILNN